MCYAIVPYTMPQAPLGLAGPPGCGRAEVGRTNIGFIEKTSTYDIL